MKIKRWRALFRRHDFLLQFLLPYLCILLLFIPLTIFTTNRLLNAATRHTADIVYQELERTADLFDRQFSEMRDLSYTLAKDPSVVAAGRLPPPEEITPPDYIDLMTLEEDIARYYQSSDSIEGLSLWFDRSEIARIGTTFLTADHPSYLSQYTYNGQSYAEFFSGFYHSGQLDALIKADVQLYNTTREDVLLYCVNLDILSGGNLGVCAFYQLNLSSLDRLFAFFAEKYDAAIRLDSADGETLWQAGDTGKLETLTDDPALSGIRLRDGEFSAATARTLFSTRLLAPARQTETSRMGWVLVTINAAAILLSLALSVISSHRFASPLQKTFNVLGRKEGTARHSLDQLCRSVETLVTSEQQLAQKLESERDMRKMGLFGSLLLQAGPLPEEFIRRESQSLGIDLSFPYYAAVYCAASAAPDGYPDDSGKNRLARQTIVSQALSETLARSLPGLLYIYKYQEDRYILVTGLPDESRAQTVQAMEETARSLKEALGISFRCCVGMPVPIGLVSESFQLACFVMEHAPDARAVRLVDKKDYPRQWEYNTEIEHALIQSCLAGNTRQVEALLDRIFGGISDFSPINLYQMTYSFRGTILRILSNFPGANILPATAQSQHLTGCRNFDELHTAVRRIMRSICLLIQNEKNAKQENLYRQILDYIARSYADPDLTLTRVADHFHLNEKYLSHFFKETGGTNFSAMVEKIRMEKIIQYMRETDLPISEICLRCGYSSSNSFYKAFKRIYGVSPNSYRRQL